MKYHANVWVEVEDTDFDGGHGQPDLGDLREHLEDAVVLDLDVESQGSLGVVAIEIDWDSLQPG